MLKKISVFIIVLAVITAAVICISVFRKRKYKRRQVWKRKMYEADSEIAVTEQSKKILRDKENKIGFKIQMYVISLWLLFVLMIPISIKPPHIDDEQQVFISIGGWMKENCLLLVSLFMVLVGYLLYKGLEYRWRGTRNLSVRVVETKNENFEYLTFLTTYIIPMVCINLDEQRYVIVLFLLLVISGIIFVKSDFYLGNPTLALMGYRLYEIQYELNGKTYEAQIISKDKIQTDDYIEYIPFDKRTWYVRRSGK